MASDKKIALEIRDGRLVAELNESYYRHRAESAVRWDVGLRWISVFLGTSAAVTFQRAMPPEVPTTLGLVAAAGTCATLVFRFGENARRWGELAAKWTEVVKEYRLLALESSPTEEHLQRLVTLSEDLQREDTTRRRTRLSRKLQREVEKQNGLLQPAPTRMISGKPA